MSASRGDDDAAFRRLLLDVARHGDDPVPGARVRAHDALRGRRHASPWRAAARAVASLAYVTAALAAFALVLRPGMEGSAPEGSAGAGGLASPAALQGADAAPQPSRVSVRTTPDLGAGRFLRAQRPWRPPRAPRGRALARPVASLGSGPPARRSGIARCRLLLPPSPIRSSLMSLSFDELVAHPGDDDNLARIKLLVGVLALIALWSEAQRDSEGRAVSARWKKLAGGGLAVLSVLSYFHFFDIGYRDFYHRHELFHYYLGAKYFPEIGFEGIYGCTAVAESELPDGSAGPGDRPSQTVKRRKLRDLRVNLIVDTAEWTAHPERCKDGDAVEGRAAFTPARWDAFKHDVAFFRRVSLGGYWDGMQKDHGYNPPPTWAIAGRFFAELHPADERTMKALSAIDPLLFAGMFGLIAWAFGWRVMCVGVVFWGLNDAAPFYWTGGAFLRQDWLVATIASACLVRKGHYAWGGAALMYATLLRVFPVFLFLGWAFSMLGHAFRVWRADPSAARGGVRRALLALTTSMHRRIAAGAAVAALVLVPLAAWNHGLHAWPNFVRHIAVHNATPLTNHMGWKTLVAHSEAGRAQVAEDPRLADSFATWKAMRRERVKRLWPVHVGGMLVMMAFFAWVTTRLKSPWIVLALSCLPAMVLIELTDYYYSFFLLGALLVRGRRALEVALVAAAIASEVCHLGYRYFDDRFVAMSVVYLALALFMVATFARRPAEAS